MVIISHLYCHHTTLGVTKVRPLVQDPGQEETQSSGSSSRVSSAKSLVSSMFSGSEEEEEYDAYAQARKVNLYGQVRTSSSCGH